MKRFFDVVFSVVVLLSLGWLILLCYVLACIETRSNGLFVQQRVGQYGQLFWICKLKTMHPKSHQIGFFGRIFRKYKLDELPQFYNVLTGDMSVVGPRPDVPGYYDCLQGDDRRLLELKPGITSEASLKNTVGVIINQTLNTTTVSTVSPIFISPTTSSNTVQPTSVEPIAVQPISTSSSSTTTTV